MVHVYITGFVQGIGFRQFVKHNARKLDLNGWVRNLPASRQGGPDGRVEAVFDGNRENIEKIIELCKKGPFLSEVKNVEIDWNSPIKLDTIGFEIIK